MPRTTPSDSAQIARLARSGRDLFRSAPIEIDPSVKVLVPSVVEDQAQVPITADARALSNVVEMVIIADLNPIRQVLRYAPTKAQPYISLRIKLEQRLRFGSARERPMACGM